MNFISAKKSSDIKLPGGLVADVEQVDGCTRGVSIRTPEGAVLLVARGDWSISVTVPAPPKMIKKFRLTGELRGVKYEEMFDDKYAAETRGRALSDDGELAGEIAEIEVAE